VKTTGDDFLLPDQAFRFDALAAGSDQVVLNWEIAEGYYLYRARIKVTTPSASAQLGAPQFPAGQFKTDEYFGRQEIYTRELRVTVPVARAYIKAAPQRVVWASDWPHPTEKDKPNDAVLFDLLAEWVPDAATRTAILVDNPATLYGFAKSA